MAMLTGCAEKQVPQAHLKPDRQAGLLAFYESHPVCAGDIVLVGDDLIADGLWKEIFPDKSIKNRGIPGDCLADVAVRAKIIAAAHPDKMFICAGMNDFERAALEKPEDQKYPEYKQTIYDVAIGLQKLFRDLHRISPKTELYWLSLYEIAAMEPGAYPAMQIVNKAVEAYAKKSGYFTVLNMDGAISQAIDEEEYTFTKGRWLNSFGYARVSGFIAARLCASNGMSLEINPFTEAQYENVRNWNGSRPPEGRVAEYYLDRLSQFLALPRGKGGVVLFGDSLIDFGPWYELLPEYSVHPRGIAGDKLKGYTARVEEVASQNPQGIVLMGGCNDLVKSPDLSPETIWKDYEELLAAIRKAMPEVPLFVESILPLNPKDAGEYEGFNARAAAVNEHLAAPDNRLKYNYEYLDLAALLCDEKGDLRDEYTTDGCHLTPAAYQVWADQLRGVPGGLDQKRN